MQRTPSFWAAVALSVLLVGMPYVNVSIDSHLANFLGRFHPLLIHFPIVAVVIAAVLEWHYRSGQREVQVLVQWSYRLAFYSALLATGLGWLLFKSGDYAGTYIVRHQWFAIAMTIALLWSMCIRQNYLDHRHTFHQKIYQFLLVVAVVLMGITGHLGGSVTHGSDFLQAPLVAMHAERALSKTTEISEPASLGVYEDMVRPILNAKCAKCHNVANTKGGLLMDDFEGLMAGGKSGAPTIVPGQPNGSELIVRVLLPPSDDEYMPPDGRTPLTPDEVNLISWWISAGASPSDTLGSGPRDSLAKESIAKLLPALAGYQVQKNRTRKERQNLSPKLIRLGIENGLNIASDPETDSTMYSVSMQLPAKIVTDENIAQLLPYADVFSKISLVSADITDEALYHLGQMANLRELILVKCCITGEGLAYLQDLSNLELLNLSYTDVDDVHALSLSKFKRLKRVYLFHTKTTAPVIETLNQHLSDTNISFEEGPYF